MEGKVRRGQARSEVEHHSRSQPGPPALSSGFSPLIIADLCLTLAFQDDPRELFIDHQEVGEELGFGDQLLQAWKVSLLPVLSRSPTLI